MKVIVDNAILNLITFYDNFILYLKIAVLNFFLVTVTKNLKMK